MRHARLKQCKATTLTGERCTRPASPHSDFCWQHAADASRSKTELAVDLAMPSAIPVEDDFGWGPTIDKVTWNAFRGLLRAWRWHHRDDQPHLRTFLPPR